MSIATSGHAAIAQSDEYIQGYVQSLLVNSYNLPADAVSVNHSSVYIHENQINGGIPAEQLIAKLKQATAHLNIKKIVLNKNHQETIPLPEKPEPIDGLMPSHSLFHALIADPKWPRFTLAYQYFFKNRIAKQAFAPNFGASIPIYRNVIGTTEWEFGIQGGLFAILDIGKNPSALVNADYYISFPISFRNGAWSFLARAYHTSSHLGDEFMLTPQGKATKRINLSVEGIDLLASYDFKSGMRLYGGGGTIVHKDPHYIKPLKVQLGAEYRSDNTWWDGKLRPITGLDIKSEQMANWTPGISFKTGVQIENSALISNEIQLMFEAYSGKSMHGQFYSDKIRYIGIGLHAFL